MRDLLSLEFYTKATHPYYVVTPPYTRFSAGVKALHLLCHNLNQNGQSAYLIPIGDESLFHREDFCEIDLLTPILTRSIAQYHFNKGLTPITVYPEIVSGAPYGGACVIRYILNFPGLLGGDASYDPEEICFSYSKVLATTTNKPENVLFIPTSDPRIFYPPDGNARREGSCFYAAKYQNSHHGKLFEVTYDSVEITSGKTDSQTPTEIAELFRKSEIFYTYENTALATEAALCGCPVVFLPNPHLTSIIATEELGTDGFAWGNSLEEVGRARETVPLAFSNYMQSINKFYEDLNAFIKKTQEHSKAKNYSLSNLEMLLSHLPKINDKNWKNDYYAPLLMKLPPVIEKQIGALLCSAGLKLDGEFLWNRAIRRSRRKRP